MIADRATARDRPGCAAGFDMSPARSYPRPVKPIYRRMLRVMRAGEESRPGASSVVWHLYILECGDGSYYTGVTTDIERRLREHRAGKASRYTRTRRPLELVHREECGTRSQALSRECAVKSMSRDRKCALIQGSPPESKAKPRGRRR